MTESSGFETSGEVSLSLSKPSLNNTSVPLVLVIIAKVLHSKSSGAINLSNCSKSTINTAAFKPFCSLFQWPEYINIIGNHLPVSCFNPIRSPSSQARQVACCYDYERTRLLF
jgi:hypothetical protein